MSTRKELEKFIRERLKDSDEECAKELERRGIQDLITPEMQERMIQLYVDEAVRDCMTVEKMEENIEKSKPLIAARNKAIAEGQPFIIRRKDAATGVPLVKANCGTYQTVNPNDLIILYDFCVAAIRLSKQKEWVDLREIIEEIDNSEYVADWTAKVFPIYLYADFEHLIEINEDNGKFRLVPGKKLSIIKRFLEHFDRPDEVLNYAIDILYESARQTQK